jgi:hypothetical protein
MAVAVTDDAIGVTENRTWYVETSYSHRTRRRRSLPGDEFEVSVA